MSRALSRHLSRPNGSLLVRGLGRFGALFKRGWCHRHFSRFCGSGTARKKRCSFDSLLITNRWAVGPTTPISVGYERHFYFRLTVCLEREGPTMFTAKPQKNRAAATQNFDEHL